MQSNYRNRIDEAVNAEFAKIEAQKRENTELWKNVYAAGDLVLFQEAVKEWENGGFKGNRPERTAFIGSWEKLLNEKNKVETQQQAEVMAFEKQVEENLKLTMQKYF
jgi:hypothetical protein